MADVAPAMNEAQRLIFANQCSALRDRAILERKGSLPAERSQANWWCKYKKLPALSVKGGRNSKVRKTAARLWSGCRL